MVASRTRAVAIWLMALAPVVFLPGLDTRWGWPTLVCVTAAAVLAASVAPAGRLPRWYAVLVGATVALLVATAILGSAPLMQLLGRAPRYEGLIVIVVLIAAGWTGARLLGPDAVPTDQRQFTSALTVASVLLALVAVLEAFGLRPIESDLARPGSLAGNATDQAILGAVFAAVLGATALGAYRRRAEADWRAVTGAVAGVVSVATSASRAGVLALAIVAVGLIVLLIVTSRHRRRDGLAAAGAAIAAFLVVIAMPLTRDRLFGASAFAQQTIGDRLIMWEATWRLFLSSPWSGVGANGYADAITGYLPDGWFERAQVGAILDSPHNIVLQAAVSAGIPGLLFSAVLVAGALTLGVRHAYRASGHRADPLWGAVIGLVAGGAALLTHVTSPTVLTPLAVLSGALLALPAARCASTVSTKRGGPVAAAVGRPWPVWARVVGAVWLVFLLVCTVADGILRDAKVATTRGDLDRALASFEAAQTLRPWDVDIALDAAQALGGAVENGLAGAADPAAEWARRAVTVIPGSSRAQYVTGMIASIRGETETAAEHLGIAAELSPADPRIHHELGVVHLVFGDPVAAASHLERAVELAPSSEVSWIALRDACRAAGDAECVRRTEAMVAAE